MTSIEVFKSTMAKGLKVFFEEYESSIKELIDKLDSDKLLLRSFNEEQVNRLMQLTRSCNMSLSLSSDLYSIVSLDETKRKENIDNLKKAFRTSDQVRIGEHVLSALVNAYIANLEKLKIYFLFFIDWNKLGKKHKDIYGISSALRELIKKYPDNKYLNYFNKDARNSFAHFSFFFGVGSKVYLCSDIFDKSPKEMNLDQLMKEIWNLNTLTEGFYLMVRDKYGVPDINSEMFER